MRVVFSVHASLKIGQRKLPMRKILETIDRPESRTPSYGMRTELYKRFGKNRLKVVVIEEGGDIVVVTAHWVARSPKK